MMAIHYGYGAAPEGPAGTGKTETTKELAKSIGKMSFVFNCSSSLSYEAMLKFFKGFASGGGWSCFDEFNRIEPRALSAISQIILSVNQARREKSTTIQLDGGDPLPFDYSCCVFITMNPFTMGRTKLPDNLKAQFRPVQMILPNLRVITEVILYCNGFLTSDELSTKITKVFEFAKMQLGGSTFYDFGLRSLKAVVEQAGRLKLLISGCIDQQELESQKGKNTLEDFLNHEQTKTMEVMVNKQQSRDEKEAAKKEKHKNQRSQSMMNVTGFSFGVAQNLEMGKQKSNDESNIIEEKMNTRRQLTFRANHKMEEQEHGGELTSDRIIEEDEGPSLSDDIKDVTGSLNGSNPVERHQSSIEEIGRNRRKLNLESEFTIQSIEKKVLW